MFVLRLTPVPRKPILVLNPKEVLGQPVIVKRNKPNRKVMVSKGSRKEQVRGTRGTQGHLTGTSKSFSFERQKS